MNFVPSYQCTDLPLAPPAKRPLTGDTLLRTIFSSKHPGGWHPDGWQSVQVRDFHSRSKINHNMLTVLLDAPPFEQRQFLLALYDEFAPDAAAIITFDTLVKRRRLLDIIDKSDAARERVALVYLGVMAGIEYGKLPTYQTGWATGRDNP